MQMLWNWIQLALVMLFALLAGALIVIGVIADWRLRAQRLRRKRQE